jgi:hypothetical protein
VPDEQPDGTHAGGVAQGRMYYLDLIAGIHAALQPRTYLEVGIRNGESLTLSRCPSIGIDPNFQIHCALRAPTRVYRTTSDEYFASLGEHGPFGSTPIDFAFIDGMHLFEFALSDFINIERWSDRSTVVVFDDVFPRDVDEAARTRHTTAWTGDIFKLQQILRDERPDLKTILVDTEPTGLMFVLGLDPFNRTLAENIDRIVSRYDVPDPQDVPVEVFNRSLAVEPHGVLALPIWEEIRTKRNTMVQ